MIVNLNNKKVSDEREINKSIKVLFIFRRKRKERMELYLSGDGPDEMLYGLNHFPKDKFDVKFIEGDNESTKSNFVLKFVQKSITRMIKMGFELDLILSYLGQIKKSDVVIATVDSVGLPLAFLKRVGVIKTPTIYISQGLSDRILNKSLRFLTRISFIIFYSSILSCVERFLVLGEGAKDPFCNVFKLSKDKVYVLHFGIDNRFWTPNSNKYCEDYILSVGSDLARDYDTLVDAIKDEKCLIVTRLPVTKKILGKKITVDSQFSDIELRTLYRKCRYVVTPLKDVAQPSGQSATLQAMACGKTVILTKTKGLWDSKIMKHLYNCYLVPPGNVSKLREAFDYFDLHPEETRRIGNNALKTIDSHYDSQIFSEEITKHIEDLDINGN